MHINQEHWSKSQPKITLNSETINIHSYINAKPTTRKQYNPKLLSYKINNSILCHKIHNKSLIYNSEIQRYKQINILNSPSRPKCQQIWFKLIVEFSFRFSSFQPSNRSGQSSPPMYTEVLPGDQSLALMITSLTEGMAGQYFCSASYANTALEISVQIETYSELRLNTFRVLKLHVT